MKSRSQRISITLPREAAERLRAEAARLHLPVSQFVNLAIERYFCDMEAREFARRAELFARAALLAALDHLGPEARREAMLRLLGEAQLQMKRMQERREKGCG